MIKGTESNGASNRKGIVSHSQVESAVAQRNGIPAAGRSSSGILLGQAVALSTVLPERLAAGRGGKRPPER